MLTHFSDGTPVPMTVSVDGRLVKDLTREELEEALLRACRDIKKLREENHKLMLESIRYG